MKWKDFETEANLPAIFSALLHTTCGPKEIIMNRTSQMEISNKTTIPWAFFLFSLKLYLKIINWRHCSVSCPPLVPLPESISSFWTQQLGSLVFLEVLDQQKCSISTCQGISSCEGQQGKNNSQWLQTPHQFQRVTVKSTNDFCLFFF